MHNTTKEMKEDPLGLRRGSSLNLSFYFDPMSGGDPESHSILCSVKAQKRDTTLVWGGLCFTLFEMIPHTYFEIFCIFDILDMHMKLFSGEIHVTFYMRSPSRRGTMNQLL